MQIYVTRNGQQYGPYDEAALKAGLQNGSFTPADLVWYEGAAGWAPLSTLPGIAATAPAVAEVPPPPPASPLMVPLPPGAATASGKKPTQKWVRYLSTATTIAAVIIGLLIFFGRREMMGTRYKASDKESVNYSGGATEAEARQVAEALKAEGYFDGSKAVDVLLRKEKGQTIISFVMDHGWNEEKYEAPFRNFGTALVKAGSLSRPLTIRFVDTKLNTKKEIPIN